MADTPVFILFYIVFLIKAEQNVNHYHYRSEALLVIVCRLIECIIFNFPKANRSTAAIFEPPFSFFVFFVLSKCILKKELQGQYFQNNYIIFLRPCV